MKILIVYAHPEPRSFNGAMFHAAQKALTAADHEVRVSDLYAMNFDPVSGPQNFIRLQNPVFFKQQLEEMYASEKQLFIRQINEEQDKLEWCDLMIWQFPLWWFSVPGIMKGWVDRVFAMGRVYGSGRIYDTGVFIGKRALLSLTTGGPQEDYIDGGLQGDLTGILRPILRGILQFTGFSVLQPHVVHGPARMSADDRHLELERWQSRLDDIFSEPEMLVGQY